MKTLIIVILTLTATYMTAQNTVTWLGGTPGKETKWTESKNWSNHRVPDEFSNVVIPDVSSTTFASPVIESGKVEINSISLASTTTLTINQRAQLTIHENAEGIVKQNLQLKGLLVLLDQTDSGKHIAASNENLQN